MINFDNCNLIKANKDIYDDYYQIRKEKKNMFWTGYNSEPDYNRFFEWFIERVHDPNREIYLLYYKNVCAGALHLDFNSGYASIGYNVKEKYEGKGFGTYLVKKSIEIVNNYKLQKKISYIQAWINENNIASIKVILKNNFQKSDKKEIRKHFGHNKIFHEYILYI